MSNHFGSWITVRTAAALAFCGFGGLLFQREAQAVQSATIPVVADDSEKVRLHLVGGRQVGLVPVFSAAPRDRASGELAASWWPDERVRLAVSADWLVDTYPSNSRSGGPGDLRLGTLALAWRGPVDVGLGWEVKLPNARDEGELGTDETDVTLLVNAAGDLGAAHLGATAGLAVLGNPLQFANQDDIPVLWLGGELPVGPLDILARAGGGLATARNPARLDATAGVQLHCPVLLGVDATAGLTPAAPDWATSAWVGWSSSCER